MNRFPTAVGLLLALVVFTGCSPLYVVRAGIAQARLLAAREPIPEVVTDPSVDADTRGKLILAREARIFAREGVGLDVGQAYTSFVRLERDTLALVLSAAPRDRLVPRTWWFPVVGHVPYRGFFSEEEALEARAELEEEGYDTWLRPTAAFSTLGWFADPLPSTLLRRDHVEVVETVLHELSHAHLFVPGRVRFNESYATFVGRVGAVEFFCGREGGGPDTVWCRRAEARWRDVQRFSRFLDGLVADLEALYGNGALSREEKVRRREDVFRDARHRFVAEVQPDFESLTFQGFLDRPLNNATILARMRYYHRLPDFQRLYEARGSELAAAVEGLSTGVANVDDPFDLLPTGGS
jgi:predicted aminopeptidase